MRPRPPCSYRPRLGCCPGRLSPWTSIVRGMNAGARANGNNRYQATGSPAMSVPTRPLTHNIGVPTTTPAPVPRWPVADHGRPRACPSMPSMPPMPPMPSMSRRFHSSAPRFLSARRRLRPNVAKDDHPCPHLAKSVRRTSALSARDPRSQPAGALRHRHALGPTHAPAALPTAQEFTLSLVPPRFLPRVTSGQSLHRAIWLRCQSGHERPLHAKKRTKRPPLSRGEVSRLGEPGAV